VITTASAGHAGGGPNWRADIDGLRAVAILAVVGFHFFPYWLPTGFIGVDIFFVISGYLVTRILLAAHAAGSFSILSFYAARIRRIFPALALVLVTVMVAGWAALYADERVALGRHVLAGAGFVANLLLWRENGYFDAAIEAKPLAHLWSLGVEEQFYLLWPLVLALVVASRYRVWPIAVLAAASFLANVMLVDQAQHTVFYLPVFRFWELLAGALLAVAEAESLLAPLARRAASVSAGGFALLAAGILLVPGSAGFPGAWAALPVLGATLVIAAGPQAPLNRLLLSNRCMVGIGLVSYPLYLWHWPLLSFVRIVFQVEPGVPAMAALLVLSFLLAWVTWKLVEAPVRAPRQGPRKAMVLGALMAAVAIAGLRFDVAGGAVPGDRAWVATTSIRPEVLLERNTDLAEGCGLVDPAARSLVRYCLHDARGPERFALVGDSKAQVLFNGLARTSSPGGRWLFVGGALQHGGLVPALSERPQHRHAQPAVRAALGALARNPRIETVVVATATRALFQLPREDSIEDLAQGPNRDAALEGLRAFTGELLRAGKKVVLLVDNPTLPDVRKCLLPERFRALQPLADRFGRSVAAGCKLSPQRHRELSRPYLDLLEEVRRMAPGRIAIFDTVPLLCDLDQGSCPSSDRVAPLYSYTDHISDHAAGKIGAALNAQLGASGSLP